MSFNPGEVKLHRDNFVCCRDSPRDSSDRSCANAFLSNRPAVKNCYPAKIPWPLPAQNASAETDGARSQRSVLIVVNKSHSRRFDPLSQPLV